jgi:putative DNA primase/helicase
VIEELVGSKNFSGIKLKQLGDDFGQQSLIGKLVAVVTDARVGSKVDKGSLVETILTISGEDTVSINRKNLPHWQGKLSVRFFLHTNELPQLEDMSGALASRFILLTTEASFLGREDHELGDKLKEERAGILLWAIEGYRRLRERGRFVQPPSSERMLRLLAHMSSPIASFVGECCELDPGFSCMKDALYGTYRQWLIEQGRSHVPTKDVFSTKLYAAFPAISEGKGPREVGRKPEYRGIRLFVPDHSGTQDDSLLF